MSSNESLEFLHKKKAMLEKELKHADSLVEFYNKGGSAAKFSNQVKLRNNIANELKLVNQQILSAKALIDIGTRTKTIAEKSAELVEKLNSSPDNKMQLKELGSQVASLAESSQKTIEQIKKQSLSSLLMPQMSILRPNVKLIDANLAYRYADLQSDTNIFIGLASLFLGTAIATAISLGVSRATSAESSVISIYWAVTIMSLIVTGMFGCLAFRAHRRSIEARHQIEAEAREIELPEIYLEQDNNGALTNNAS